MVDPVYLIHNSNNEVAGYLLLFKQIYNST